MTAEELKRVEDIVNEKINEAIEYLDIRCILYMCTTAEFLRKIAH